MAIWTNEVNPFGQNRTPLLIGLSKTDGVTVVPVAVDPTNGQIQTNGGGGGGGGFQYQAGGSTTGAYGNALVFDPGNGTFDAVSTANPLPVSATFSGTITSSPTFAMSPASSPTAAYGLIDSSYRQVVVGPGTAGSPAGGVLSIQGVSGGTVLPISAASLPLPTGAATAAKQPSLGTAGSASTDVLTIQGIASMTALKVDGSGVTQPISGTVTTTPPSNASTNITQVGGSTFALGQQLAAASLPVVLTAAQIITLTPPAAITNYALETGGNLATLAGTVTSSVLQGNVKQINGVVPLMGNGTTGTGSLRVTIASDNTAFAVNATLQSGSTTAVTQATGTNLHTVVDSGTITAVTAITNPLPAGTNGIGNVGTVSAVVNVGQKTVNTTAVQISVTSTVPTNGIIIQALSANAASIFVGGSSVTTSTGFELVAGQAMSFTANLNTLYIISAASTTDKVCWNVE